jgi:hypothetical protein
MGVTKRIVCLANSRKLHGRCVAGKELIDDRPGAWIRPVSARSTGELWLTERCYAGGNDPELLDIVDVPLQNAHPHLYQKENWLIDSTKRWTKVAAFDGGNLGRLVDAGASLWINGFSSSKGINDRVPEDQAANLTDSLRFFHVRDCSFSIYEWTNEFGTTKLQVRARFSVSGVSYNFRVTDTAIEQVARNNPGVLSGQKPCYLTISLGEPFQGYVYKLIAAVIGWA